MHTNRHTPQFKSWGICKTGLGFHAQSSQTGSESLFGWIAAQIPVQPHKCSAFGLRGVAVRMHWSTAADQPKSYESCLTVVTLIEGCPRKRNSAKQALKLYPMRETQRADTSGSPGRGRVDFMN